MGCGIAIHICDGRSASHSSSALTCKPVAHAKGNDIGAQGKAQARLRKNMWCMMCKDAAATQLVRLVSKDSILTATRLLASPIPLHRPSSSSEASVSTALLNIIV